MVISDNTLKFLNENFIYNFYDDNANIVPPELASELVIIADMDKNIIHTTIKALKKEITIEYIMNKIGSDATYQNFTTYFNSIIKQYGLNAYPTTYGIGVFVAIGFRKHIEEIKSKIEDLLTNSGIKYTTEYSNQYWVFRYKISKSQENIKQIETLLNNN